MASKQARIRRAEAALATAELPPHPGREGPSPVFSIQAATGMQDLFKAAATGHTREGGAIWGAPKGGPRGDRLPVASQNCAMLFNWPAKSAALGHSLCAQLAIEVDPPAWRDAFVGNDAGPICAPLRQTAPYTSILYIYYIPLLGTIYPHFKGTRRILVKSATCHF